MTFSERMVAGSLGGMVLMVGGRICWLIGAEALMAVLALGLLVVGGICVVGAITLGDDDGR